MLLLTSEIEQPEHEHEHAHYNKVSWGCQVL